MVTYSETMDTILDLVRERGPVSVGAVAVLYCKHDADAAEGDELTKLRRVAQYVKYLGRRGYFVRLPEGLIITPRGEARLAALRKELARGV